MSRMESYYKAEQIEGGKKFAVDPAKGGWFFKSGTALMLGLAPAFLVFVLQDAIGLGRASNTFEQIVGLLFTGAFFVCWFACSRLIKNHFSKLDRKNRHAYKTTFTVRKGEIEIEGGKRFIGPQIGRLSIKNNYDSNIDIALPSYAFVGSATGVGIGLASVGITGLAANSLMAVKDGTTSVSYVIAMEADGRRTDLAGGLTAQCATALLNDIGSVLYQ